MNSTHAIRFFRFVMFSCLILLLPGLVPLGAQEQTGRNIPDAPFPPTKGRFAYSRNRGIKQMHRPHWNKRRNKPEPRAQSRMAPLAELRKSTVDSAAIRWQRNFGTYAAPSIEQVAALTADNAGNVYMTGWSSTQPFGSDYLTQKYDAGGNLLWEARFSGSGNGDNQAKVVAVDAAGDVAVSGIAYNPATQSYDVTTVYHNSSGTEQWSAVVPNSLVRQSFDDDAAAIAFDASGNIYVAGSVLAPDSTGQIIVSDLLIVKYSPSGALLWMDLYDSGMQSWDWAEDLAVDGSGNAYVTGGSRAANLDDYITLKYSSNGTRLWEARYDNGGYEVATSIAVDNSGNAYVTGSDGDFVTIKYDNAGNQVWLKRLDGPVGRDDYAYDLSLDNAGNVLVTGATEEYFGNFDFLTIKYSGNGDSLWAVTYTGTPDNDEGPYALTIDASDNIYVVGYADTTGGGAYTITTVKYDPTGAEQWSRRMGDYADPELPGQITLSSTGQVVIGATTWHSGTENDANLHAYLNNGGTAWQQLYTGTSNNTWETVSKMVQDAAGNIYVAGQSWDGDYDFFAAKFDGDGNLLWFNRSDGGSGFDDFPSGMAVDGDGNVYVGGYTSTFSNSNFMTVKYDASGNEQWIRTYNGSANRDDIIRDITLDNLGNIVVTGESDNDNQYNGPLVTIKYDPAGNTLWTARHQILADATPLRAVSDAAGNVYVAGAAKQAGSNWDFLIVKYDSNGDTLWTLNNTTFHNNTSFFAFDMALDSAGNLYASGNDFLSGSLIVKADAASGDTLWTIKRTFTGSWEHLAVDASNNLYVAGTLNNAFFIINKYDPAGNELWSQTYSDYSGQSNAIQAITIDANDNVYVSGRSTGNGNIDFLTLKYASDGTLQWTSRYDVAARENEPRSIAVDGFGNVTVVGSTISYDWAAVTLVQYAQLPTGIVVKDDPAAVTSFQLKQNYPNPFNPVTTIGFRIARRGWVELSITDMLGREVKTLVSKTFPPGEYEVQWDGTNNAGQPVASGVYLYRLKAGNGFKEIKKMILMK